MIHLQIMKQPLLNELMITYNSDEIVALDIVTELLQLLQQHSIELLQIYIKHENI